MLAMIKLIYMDLIPGKIWPSAKKILSYGLLILKKTIKTKIIKAASQNLKREFVYYSKARFKYYSFSKFAHLNTTTLGIEKSSH